MSLPASLLIGIVDYWTFDAGVAVGTDWTQLITDGGGGPHIQIGHLQASQLHLNYLQTFVGTPPRGRFGYGKEQVINTDWYDGVTNRVPAGRWTYANGGDVDPGGALLANTGDGVTIAIRYCPEGITYTGDGSNSIWIPNSFRQVLCAIGYLDAEQNREVIAADFNNEACGASSAVPFRLWHKSSTNSVTVANVSGSSVPGAGSAVSLESGTFPPFNAVLRFVRVGPNEISLEVFIDGVKTGTIGSKITSDFASTPMSYVSIGKATNADMGSPAQGAFGGVTEAALWTRALTDDEIGAIGEDGLDGIIDIQDDEETGAGTDNPLIDENGDSALNPDWPVERIADAVVLATGGPQRHTRRPHRIAPRRYRIHAAASKGGEVALIQELIRVSRGGAKATRWRHPVDDPPAARIDQLPLYRLISHTVARTRGGQFGTWELVLEEVE